EPNRDLNYYQGEGQDEGPCETEHLNVPITLVDANGERPTTTQANGTQWDNVVPDQSGTFQIIEEIPEGYGAPAVFCGTLDQDQQQPVTVTGGTITIQPAAGPFDYQCNWYNIPEGHGTVTIHKWECPQGMEIEQTLSAHQTICTQPMDNVTFTLTDSKGPRPKMTSGGLVEWTDVQIEPITVAEEIPFGYSTQPFVSCDFDSQNSLSLTDSVINGVLTATLNHPGQKIICHWFNQYLGPGDLTIYKWTCPEGYDYAAWGADPKTDCTEATNGVTFVLDQPAGVDLQTDTGDSINGAVRFGSLTPGDYVVNEIVPQGISEVFVLDCVGLYTESVHPVPLSYGPTLQIRIAGGDRIECHWYNVPAMDPDFGWMTVTKYTCWTPTYVSDIDCEVFEGGKAFDLQMWNGTAWVASTSGTTNAAGQLTWTNLAPGAYQVVEQGGTACRITSDPADAVGNPTVNANAGTTVKVYNCGVTPTSPGKTPTKYPNTGVEPVGASDDAPAGSLLAVAGLLGAGSLSRRQFLWRAAAPTIAVGVGSLLVGTGIARQTIAPIELPAGAPATPGADCLFPATPAATPGATPSAASTPVACARGAVPVTITIPVIEVDAGIEVLEIIGGAMQQPTNAEEVAWYKESARLGEGGNVLLAGHLNFWGVPEGVFYLLRQLQEGDAVELEGDDGEVYRYIVQWSEDFPSDQEPPEEALGQTEEEAITLITCGGDWNIGRAEYDHRTVVRAVRDTEAPEGTPVATPGA
ncbi:MAG: sortase, partial [Chloroflexota bacterium]|nr:sortase [Chloroflexota bacterium]